MRESRSLAAEDIALAPGEVVLEEEDDGDLGGET